MGEEPALEEFLAFVHPGVADAKRRVQCLLAAGAEVSDKLMHAVLNNEWRYWYAPVSYTHLSCFSHLEMADYGSF